MWRKLSLKGRLASLPQSMVLKSDPSRLGCKHLIISGCMVQVPASRATNMDERLLMFEIWYEIGVCSNNVLTILLINQYPTKQGNRKRCLSWFTVPAPQALPMGAKRAGGKGLGHLGQLYTFYSYNSYVYLIYISYNSYNTYKNTATSIHLHQQISSNIWILANWK